MSSAVDHGYFKTSRKALLPLEQGGDVFWNKPRVFSEWEAWQYLYGEAAAYAPHEWTLRSGSVISIARGETRPVSFRYLETRWKWGKNKVQRFLQTLVSMNRIVVGQCTSDGYTYLVVNYELYQGDRDSDGTATGQRRDKREEREEGLTTGLLTESVGRATKAKATNAWMWEAWQREFGDDLPGLRYTDTRREKFRLFHREHLAERPDAKLAFARMLKAIRGHEFWGDKPNTWKPEVCMRNAERREEIALGLRAAGTGGDAPGVVLDSGVWGRLAS